jgi:hypothetical protein
MCIGSDCRDAKCKSKSSIFPSFGSSSCPLVGRGEGWQLQLHCCCFPSSLFCHAGRVIATDNGQVSSESCFCQNACPIECIYSKIGRNVKFYWSANRFGTGYSCPILLTPSYHIRIGLEFPTMQFRGAHPLF